MSDDCISRQEAIDAINEYGSAKTCEPHHMVCVGDIVKGVQNEN